MWYVYILFCDQKIYYVGSTDVPPRRLNQHINKQSSYTRKFSDFQIFYTEALPTRVKALRREKQLKKWSVAKKKALIAGDIKLLKELSKCRDFVE